MNLIECKISYEKTMENGTQKKVTEPYLVDALSFTEAEARIIEEMKPFISGEFKVEAVKRARICELFTGEGDRYYKARVAFVTLDEKTGAEKQQKVTMLMQANDLEGAINRLKDGMKGTLADYRILSVIETQVMDIFTYKAS